MQPVFVGGLPYPLLFLEVAIWNRNSWQAIELIIRELSIRKWIAPKPVVHSG